MKEQPPEIEILVLAAGASRRMLGRDKLLEPVGEDTPLLAHVVGQACNTGYPVNATLPLAQPARNAAISGFDLRLIDVPDADTGMSASLRAFAAIAAQHTAVLVVLADMPALTTDDMNAIIDAYRATGGDKIIRATDASGRPGHPVIFPPRLVGRFAELTGDAGARSLMRDEDIHLVALPGRHATTDLDTPEDWAKWRATRT
ncbi:MAG: nucleotidyltransferase family protein [Marinosulfonomonas sp.]